MIDNVIIIWDKIYKITYLYRKDIGIETTYIDVSIVGFQDDYDEDILFYPDIFIVYAGAMIHYESCHVDSWTIDNDIITLKMKSYEQFTVKDINRNERTEVALDYYKNILRLKKLSRIIY